MAWLLIVRPLRVVDFPAIHPVIPRDYALGALKSRRGGSETGDRPNVASEGCVRIEVPVKNSHDSPMGERKLLFSLSLHPFGKLRVFSFHLHDFCEVSTDVGVVHASASTG